MIGAVIMIIAVLALLAFCRSVYRNLKAAARLDALRGGKR